MVPLDQLFGTYQDGSKWDKSRKGGGQGQANKAAQQQQAKAA